MNTPWDYNISADCETPALATPQRGYPPINGATASRQAGPNPPIGLDGPSADFDASKLALSQRPLAAVLLFLTHLA